MLNIQYAKGKLNINMKNVINELNKQNSFPLKKSANNIGLF